MSGASKNRRWAAIRGVAARDLLEFVRDRRTLFVTLLMPMAMYPILALASTLGLKTALADLDARQAPLPVAIALSGTDAEVFAQRLRSVIRSENIQGPDWPASVVIEIAPAGEARERLDAGLADTWIHLPPGAMVMLDGPGTLDLNIRLPDARRNDTRLRQHVMALMRAVADDARQRRVADAGLPATVLQPIAVRIVDEESATQDTALDGVVPTAVAAVLVLLALLTATGGFYPAIDAIAGEKERGTIETLLIVPASPLDIIKGKFLAVFAVTLASLAANAISVSLTLAVLLRLLPNRLNLGVTVSESVLCAGVTLVLFVGLAAVAAAACLAVTSAARSTKEAQNALTPVILLASGLAGSALVPGVGGPLVALVPFAGQVSVAREALVHESAWSLASLVLVSLVSSLLFTWLLLRAAAAALADEEILFRGPDSAGSLTSRPAPRDIPTPTQGFAVGLVAFALLWYAQGLAPANLVYALPIQQAALLLPLAVVTAWQRVNQWRTFRLVWPAGAGRGSVTLVAAAIAGAGLFVIGAAILIVVRDASEISPAAQEMAEKLVGLLMARPWWVSWLLISVMPAVCEELFFRGWMLAAFTGKRPSRNRIVAAVLLQAGAFAAFHLLPERIPQTFVLGAVLGWMTLRTGSLLPAIVAHAAHNAMPLVFLGLAGHSWVPDLGGGSLPRAIVIGAVAAVVVGLAIIRRSRTKGATVSRLPRGRF
jgi:sodium transport system permease protein